ncbi:MAG TPA: hypothetical protein ENO22_14740 [candidate division Zixibacteria bacterium]|nr:hypothetical protein [candidate division Zixibacteria bacterium]
MRKVAVTILTILAFSSGLLADADNQVYTRTIDFEGEKFLNVEMDFGMAELKLARGTGNYIARINGEYDADLFEVTVKYQKEGDVGTLIMKIEQKKRSFTFSNKGSENSWEVLLGDMVPMDLAVDAGMCEADFDFSGLEITGLEMDIGMASGTIIFNQPNKGRIKDFSIDAGKSSFECYGFGNANFENLEIDAGMASFDLDFSGKLVFDGNVTLDAGMSSTNIKLNHNMGTKIHYSEDWTSSVGVPDDFEKVKDGVYQTRDYDSKKGHLDFDIDISMGSVDFELAESL